MQSTDLFALGQSPWKLTLEADSQLDPTQLGKAASNERVFVLDGRNCRTATGFLREIHAKAGFISEGCSWNILNEGLHDLTWDRADAYLFVFTHADQLLVEEPRDWEKLWLIFDALFNSQKKQKHPVPRNVLFVVAPENERVLRRLFPPGLSPVFHTDS